MKLKDIVEPDFLVDLNRTVIGIDIGSRTGKAVLLHGEEYFTAITATGISMQKTANLLVSKLLEQAGLSLAEVEYIVGTGYGRINFSFEGTPSDIVTEISCHAMGAHYLNKNTRTIIDIGGQDSKAIRVDPNNGKVVEFIMNDKCAAGSGRFLEKIAGILGYRIDEIGRESLRSTEVIDISSQCVVFAESEVISLKVQGAKKEDIAAAIHLAVARRVRNLVNRVGIEPDLVFTGGVSNNEGMKKALEKIVGFPITPVKMDTIYAGALGAAIFATQYRNREAKA